MARLFSQTLIRTTSQSSNPNSSSLQTFKLGLSHHNRYSNQSGKPQLIEIDLESNNEVEVLGLRKLEDAIHSIIVRKSAPDWLPFAPGSSYWVPPRRQRRDSQGIVNYFIEGTSTMHPVPIEMEAEGDHSNEENIPDVKNAEG